MYDPQYGWVQPGVAPAYGVQPGVAPAYGVQPGVAPAYGVQPGVAPAYGVQPGVAPAYGQYGQYLPDGSLQAYAAQPGFAQPAYAQPGFAQPYDYGQIPQYAAAQAQEDPVEVFMQELGILPEEVTFFGWIAEYGLQPDTLPPTWACHTDAATGRMYYVHNVSGESVWESPISEPLRRVIDVGRHYLRAGTDTYIQDQKQLLWDQRKQEIDAWQGPYTDEEGRSYFVNSEDSTSSWSDPREEAQCLMQLEAILLDSLPQILPSPEVSDLPGFGSQLEEELDPKRSAHVGSSSSLESWPQRSASPRSPGSPTSSDWGSPASPGGTRTPRANRKALMLQVARGRSDKAGKLENKDPSGAKTAHQQMTKKMQQLDYIVKDEEEAQLLLIRRKLKKRHERQRQREKEEHEAMYGENWRKQMEAMEASKREEEANKKALADAEEQRKAKEFKERQEEEKRADEQRTREAEERRLAEEARQQELAEKTARLEEEKRVEEEQRRIKAEEERRARLLQNMKDVCFSHNVQAMRQAIKDGEEAGLLAEVMPVKQAIEEELGRRKGVALKARQAAEKLAGEFKTAKEAQDFGGAILAAQWRAAAKEVSKPFQEE